MSEDLSLLSRGTQGRREREKQQKRQTILDAAECIFARHGFHGASMDKIATEAEYAPGTIYLYFKDKDALYSLLFANKLTQMVDQVEKAAAEASGPLDSIKQAIRAQFEFHERNREFFEVFTCHRVTDQASHETEWKAIHQMLDRHHGILKGLIEKAQNRKLLRAGDSKNLAVALLGMICHMSREMSRHHVPLSGEADFVFQLFVQGSQFSS